MKSLIICSLTAAVIVLSASSAKAQTFNMTAQEFIDKYNQQSKKDGGDETKACKHGNDEYVCSFQDAGFQRSAKSFKDLNLVNGKFKSNFFVILSEEKGKLSEITVGGSRSDPMNLFYFIGKIHELIVTLKPELSDDEITKTVMNLGLMRGDDDPTIGKPRNVIEDYAEIICNNQDTRLTDATIGCVMRPRY